MSDILVRNIPEEIVEQLKSKAAGNNRSLQQELYGIIVAAARDDVDRLVERIRERRTRVAASGKVIEDSTRAVRRMRLK